MFYHLPINLQLQQDKIDGICKTVFLFLVFITNILKLLPPHSFKVLSASHAHSYLHDPGINGVSMSHEWAIIKDEVIYICTGKAARNTENIPIISLWWVNKEKRDLSKI